MTNDSEDGRTDMMTPDQRSRCMSRIRGKNTKPEIMLRRALWKRGYRYRIHHKLPGRPDLAFPGKEIAVFIDGCFWHGCPEHAVSPKSNADFWRKKIQGNIDRDAKVTAELEKAGWKVLRFWEHEVNHTLDSVVSRVMREVAGDAQILYSHESDSYPRIK